ncbi:MAG: biotin--[acetyl-CoA-carboxylase] ligase [Pirellulaceae bacterium]|nr:biotin--[acetyl-CoA-carboxylase] ligase [Pirellulaceae bacterium]
MDHWSGQRREAAVEHLLDSGWLKHVQWLPTIDSTNSLARQLLLSGQLETPALLVADQQTAGRGRSLRQWWSPSGCLMLSLVLEPRHMPSDSSLWPQLSLVTGVAAAQAVEAEAGISVQLKWPNDLYVRDRKLAGILVEAIARPSHSESQVAFVVGLGLNVAVDWSQAPLEIKQRACSLSQFSSTPLTLESVLIRLVEQFELHLRLWHAGQSQWWQQWSERSLLTGRAVHLQMANGQELIGKCEGIDTSGCLLVYDAQQCHRIQSADIVRWE